MSATECISVFDMLKVGIGPSSSHTLGPWRAIQRWLMEELSTLHPIAVQIHLYGSLALTGRGHHTDTAICLALLGHDPVSINVDAIPKFVAEIREKQQFVLADGSCCRFDPDSDIVFHPDETLEAHPNGMVCTAKLSDGKLQSTSYFSVGGGFVLRDGESSDNADANGPKLPFPSQTAAELLSHCQSQGCSITDIVRANETAWRSATEVDEALNQLWLTMRDAIYRGCHRDGELPGGLRVKRRAAEMCRQLMAADYESSHGAAAWFARVQSYTPGFAEGLRWLSCFALAVNEENANLGRVVTAPTNGAAGVIPAVLMYHLAFNTEAQFADVHRFLLVAGEIGTYFKKGATISAALGGCQAEIGVSSAMAAGALTEVLGGSVQQALMAAEIAMEHHLGLTCDPVGGLVQVPCIERNTMGAVKAVNAAQIALMSDPQSARVSLDAVIRTMNQTARDMSAKYKETSQGGLAVNIPVGLAEC